MRSSREPRARTISQLALLGSAESWHVRDVRRAAEGRFAIVPATFRDVAAMVETAGSEVASRQPASADTSRPPVVLDACDAVLVRTMPPGSLEQIVFRMDALSQLEKLGVPVLNPPKAIETAVDKFLTTARLASAGLCVPRTFVCQTAEDAIRAFASLGGDVVVKPIFGGEGHGIARINDEAVAGRVFDLLVSLHAVLYVQEFVEHQGFDLRLLVVGDRVFGMRRISETDWRTNVSRGARAEPLEVTDDWAELAHRAATAVGAPLAGVDVLPGRDGRLYTLEVNAVPGWRSLARVTGVDIARAVLQLTECLISTNGCRNGSTTLC